MQTKLLALALLASSVSAQTFSCSGCTDYGPIGTTGYTMQYGAKMVWTANVEPGPYLVSVTFVEPIYTTKGQRPLNMWVNGTPILTAFDVIAAGGPLLPVAWHTATPDSNGKLTVVLTANNTGTVERPVKHSAIVSVISAMKLSATNPGIPPPPAQSTACQLTLTSPKLLTMSACPVQISGVFYLIPTGTIGAVTGTGQARLVIDKSTSPPAGKVYFSPTVQGSCAGMGGCTVAESGADYIADGLPVGLWTISNGTFDPNGYTPMLGTIQGFRLQSETGLVQTQSGHTVKVRVNSDVIQVQ